MRGLLVRVGIDATSGGWNAPVDPVSGEFVYVPIPEPNLVVPKLATPLDGVVPTLDAFANRHNGAESATALPRSLLNANAHLDPDFERLTYGDKPPRVNRINLLESGDLLVFYAGLRSIDPAASELIYALIGMYVVDEIVPADRVEYDRRHENAHTRREFVDPTHRVARAIPHRSGRFERCVPVGRRCPDGHYRLRDDVIDAWGGISARGGYIQRSGVLPWLLDTPRFLDWLERHNVVRVHRNNL